MTTAKAWFAALFRMLVVAVITSGIIIFLIAVAFQGQTAREQETLDEVRRGTLAQACILALPIDESGRDEDEVLNCLRRYGLEP